MKIVKAAIKSREYRNDYLIREVYFSIFKIMKINLMRTIIISLLLISVLFVKGQTGTIRGTITDAETNESLIGTTILIKGTTQGTITDFDGNFILSGLKPGNLDLVISFISYETQELNVEITEDKDTFLNIALKPATLEIGGVEVVAKANRESEKILMVERKEGTNLVQSIGARELARVAADDAAEGLKKVVGLSVQSSKFLVVRGLGDRYNASTLNGFPVASPNPDRRVLPYDIFPSDVIENIEVTKSFNPDFYGNFSGASVDISTKPYPESHTLEISLGTSMNSRSSFQDFLIDQSKRDDVFGINRVREIPLKVIEQDYNPDLRFFDSFRGEGYNNKNWFTTKFDPERNTAPLNKSVSLKYGNVIDLEFIHPESKAGYLINVNYGTGYSLEYGQIAALQNIQGLLRYDYDFEDFIFSSNTSGLGNVYFQLNKNHNINYNFLATVLTENSVMETDGKFFDFDDFIYSRRITYKLNSLFAHQVNVTNKFFHDKLSLNWGFSLSDAYADEPDRRQVALRYDQAPDPETGLIIYEMSPQDNADHHRFFTDLDDRDMAGKFHFKWNIIEDNQGSEKQVILSANGGVDYRSKTRDFRLRQFNHQIRGASVPFDDVYSIDSFFNIENLGDREYRILEGTQPWDIYYADMEITAPFMNAGIMVIPDKLTLNVGARLEMSEQFIEYSENENQLNGSEPKVKKIIKTHDFFPSITAKYNITEDLILRGSYSRTVSRPDFRELAPFEYRENFGAFRTVGNPDLVNGYNNNYDLRIEHYDSEEGLLALGLFAKDLKNPIVQNVAAGANPIKSYQNGFEGSVYGFEVEIRKNLSFITERLKNLTLNSNLSLLTSEIIIDDPADISGSTTQTNNKRKLEGASPYLVNVDLTYGKSLTKYRYHFTLAFNQFGKRLSNVGNLGVGDIFEMPWGTLNFSTSWDIGEERKLGIKLYTINLLNPEIDVMQELTPGSDEEIGLNNFKKGINMGLSLTYKVF
jgi:hypothetical protein